MNKQDDEQWLAALAGRPDPSADPATNAQANALRSAMLARREQLERDAQLADAGEFERLRARLTHEGLIQEKVTPEHNLKNTGFMAWVATWFPAKSKGSFSIPIWSLAANLILAAVVAIQLLSPKSPTPDEADVLRSDQIVTILVDDPASRLSEITLGLDSSNARYIVRKLSKDHYDLLIQESEQSMEYLNSQRIEASAINGIIKIKITSK